MEPPRNEQHSFILLKLPRELRDQIYRFILFGEDKQGEAGATRWHSLTVDKTIHPARRPDFKPSLEIRQSCCQIRHEVDETISHHAQLCIITDLVPLPPGKSFMPVPNVFFGLVTKIQVMVCIRDGRFRDTSSLKWWQELSGAKELFVNIITRRDLRWDRRTHELRSLEADIFSYVLKMAYVMPVSNPKVDDDPSWRSLPRDEFDAVAKQMPYLKGCLYNNKGMVFRKRKKAF